MNKIRCREEEMNKKRPKDAYWDRLQPEIKEGKEKKVKWKVRRRMNEDIIFDDSVRKDCHKSHPLQSDSM